VSFLVIATIVAAASAAGFTWGRRERGRQTPPGPSDRVDAVKKPAPIDAAPVEEPRPAADLAKLALSLGDVVSYERDERWLAGSLVARDGSEMVGALFFAPEGSRHEVVAAFPAPRREIFWMSAVAFESGTEPPTSVELGGGILQRKARIPVAFTRAGQGSPDVGDSGMWAEYGAAGGARAVIVRTSGGTYAFVGQGLAEGEYDRMGKGS